MCGFGGDIRATMWSNSSIPYNNQQVLGVVEVRGVVGLKLDLGFRVSAQGCWSFELDFFRMVIVAVGDKQLLMCVAVGRDCVASLLQRTMIRHLIWFY